MSPGATLGLVATFALVVAGCAGTPVLEPRTPSSAFDETFAIDGRLSARRGGEVVALAFAWTHRATRDEFVVTTPIGLVVAELSSDALTRRVEVRTADGRRDEASDWATLTERVVGFPLPVSWLAWWAQGIPHGNAPHSVERDSAGRAGVLRQDGCEIVFSYTDDSAPRPSRLGLTCDDVQIRIVIDRWRLT